MPFAAVAPTWIPLAAAAAALSGVFATLVVNGFRAERQPGFDSSVCVLAG